MIRLILLRFCESLFRNIWLYLLPIVVLTTLAIIYVLVKPPQYISWGTFYIQDESLLASLNSARDRGYSFSTPSELTVDELSELFNSAAFMRAVAQQTNLESEMSADRRTVEETLESMRQSIWAESTGQRMIFIGTGHEDPELAYQMAQSTMNTYVQWKINVSQNESAEAQQFFADLIDKYSTEIEPIRNSLTDYLISHPEPIRGERPGVEVAELERIQSQLAKAEDRISEAEAREESARLALTQAESDVRQTYLIFDAPTQTDEPVGSLTSIAITLIVFVLAGVFLSTIGVAGGAFLSRSLLFPLDVQQAFNLPVLASIPETELMMDVPVNILKANPNLKTSFLEDTANHDFTLETENYHQQRTHQSGAYPNENQQPSRQSR